MAPKKKKLSTPATAQHTFVWNNDPAIFNKDVADWISATQQTTGGTIKIVEHEAVEQGGFRTHMTIWYWVALPAGAVLRG